MILLWTHNSRSEDNSNDYEREMQSLLIKFKKYDDTCTTDKRVNHASSLFVCAASRRRWRGPWCRTAIRVRSTATACTAPTHRPVVRRPCRRRRTSPASPTCRARITERPRIPPRACRYIRLTAHRATRSRRATVPWCRALAGNRSPPRISRVT